VIDLDIRAFFDSIPHSLLLKAVSKHTDLRWVLLYVQRWLKAPLQQVDGTLVERDRGTPQGSTISPLLANLFLHYAFDNWLARNFPAVCSSVTRMMQWFTAQARPGTVRAEGHRRTDGAGRSGVASGQDTRRLL